MRDVEREFSEDFVDRYTWPLYRTLRSYCANLKSNSRMKRLKEIRNEDDREEKRCSFCGFEKKWVKKGGRGLIGFETLVLKSIAQFQINLLLICTEKGFVK